MTDKTHYEILKEAFEKCGIKAYPLHMPRENEIQLRIDEENITQSDSEFFCRLEINFCKDSGSFKEMVVK